MLAIFLSQYHYLFRCCSLKTCTAAGAGIRLQQHVAAMLNDILYIHAEKATTVKAPDSNRAAAKRTGRLLCRPLPIGADSIVETTI
jgi:hypothetical protein